MIEASAIGAAFSSFNAVKEIAKSMIGLRDAEAFKSKMIEFNERLLDAQNAVFAVNEERSALIEKISSLEQKVADLETWEREKQKYELQEVVSGVFAYAYKSGVELSEPPHFLCQNCYNTGRKSILQRQEKIGKIHLVCSACSNELHIGDKPTPEIKRITSKSSRGGW